MKFSTNLFILALFSLLRLTVIAQEQTYPVTAASFPKEVIPVDGGRIEIKAKFHGLSGAILNNEPFLFWFTDGVSTYKLGFYGNTGMVGEVGDAFFARTPGLVEPYEFGIRTYETLFSNFDFNDWHHYTLQWDKNGIPGLEDGSIKVAIFVDGIHRSNLWDGPYGSLTFPPLTKGTFNLISQEWQGELKPPISVKDIVIYDKNNNVILKNTLASPNDIQNSIVGPNGNYNGGGDASFPYFNEINSSALTAHPIFSYSPPSWPLIITCENHFQKQHNKTDYYHVPNVKTSGLFSNIFYSITGSTNRSGYGLDASGVFFPGISQIEWRAYDKFGIMQSCQMQVVIIDSTENDPGWTYYAPFTKDRNYNGKLIPAGDLNGDGFKELIAYYEDGWISNFPLNNEIYDRRFGTAYTFNGSASILSPLFKRNILEGFFGQGDYLPDFTLNSVGDVNGDGFDDLIGGTNFGHQCYVYYGSKDGLDDYYDWMWDDYKTDEDYLGYSILGKNAGDVNGDGFSDIVLTGDQSPMAVVFYGSSTGLKSFFDWSFSGSELFPDEGISMGDIDNDGYDELAIVYSNKMFALFRGTASGLSKTPIFVQKFPGWYKINITADGDLNGDHFSDVVMSGFGPGDSSTYILYGSAFGLDTAGVKIGYLNSPNFVGDINGDGFDDMVGNRLIFYGSTKGFFPIPDALVVGLTHQVGKAGDINHDGFGDVLGRTIDEMQLYYGFDKSQVYQEKIDLCGTKDKQYSLPKLYVNLPGSTVQYTVTGATKRTGSGTDASGAFNNGASYLLWKVLDQDGKQYSWKTTVMVSPYLGVDINDAYAVMPGGEPNTIYLGYGKQNLTLRAKVTGGQGKRTYKWSTGSNASSITVQPTIEGFYWYHLWVTDANGCMTADSVMVKVIDVRCDQKVTSNLNKYLPGWQSWRVLQGFVKDNSFIKVCIPLKGKWISTCVTARMVPSIFAKGGKLGACPSNDQLIVKAESYKDSKTAEILSIKVSPNPSPSGFNLEVNGNTNEQLNLLIRDPLGRIVERINCAYASRLAIGAKLEKGIYFVELRQGKQRKVVRVVKI